MPWGPLLAKGKIALHATSRQEIDSLRGVVERDLKDAALPALSADRRFATAYNAALQLSKMAIACSGYRVASGFGHHQTTIDAVKIALGPPAANLADYFELCRRKRNTLDYDASNVATETEAEEIVKKVEEFRTLVEDWIAQHYPNLA